MRPSSRYQRGGRGAVADHVGRRVIRRLAGGDGQRFADLHPVPLQLRIRGDPVDRLLAGDRPGDGQQQVQGVDAVELARVDQGECVFVGEVNSFGAAEQLARPGGLLDPDVSDRHFHAQTLLVRQERNDRVQDHRRHLDDGLQVDGFQHLLQLLTDGRGPRLSVRSAPVLADQQNQPGCLGAGAVPGDPLAQTGDEDRQHFGQPVLADRGRDDARAQVGDRLHDLGDVGPSDEAVVRDRLLVRGPVEQDLVLGLLVVVINRFPRRVFAGDDEKAGQLPLVGERRQDPEAESSGAENGPALLVGGGFVVRPRAQKRAVARWARIETRYPSQM